MNTDNGDSSPVAVQTIVRPVAAVTTSYRPDKRPHDPNRPPGQVCRAAGRAARPVTIGYRSERVLLWCEMPGPEQLKPECSAKPRPFAKLVGTIITFSVFATSIYRRTPPTICVR